MKQGIKIFFNILLYILIAILMTGVVGVFVGLFGIFLGNSPNELKSIINNNIFILIIISYVFSLIMYKMVFSIKKEKFIKRFCFNKFEKTHLGYITMMAVGLSLIACSIMAIIKGEGSAYNSVLSNISSNGYKIFSVVLLVCVIPIFEEIVFRGLIFTELRRGLSFEISAVIQALIFGICHMDVVQGIYTFLLGLLLCFVYEGTVSIWSNIYLHGVFNLLGVLIVPLIMPSNIIIRCAYIIIGIALVAFSSYKFYSVVDMPRKKAIQSFQPEYFL